LDISQEFPTEGRIYVSTMAASGAGNGIRKAERTRGSIAVDRRIVQYGHEEWQRWQQAGGQGANFDVDVLADSLGIASSKRYESDSATPSASGKRDAARVGQNGKPVRRWIGR